MKSVTVSKSDFFTYIKAQHKLLWPGLLSVLGLPADTEVVTLALAVDVRDAKNGQAGCVIAEIVQHLLRDDDSWTWKQYVDAALRYKACRKMQASVHAVAEGKEQAADNVADAILENGQAWPEDKATYLLGLASIYSNL